MNTQLSPRLGTDDLRNPGSGAGKEARPLFAALHRRRLLRADALTVAAWGSLAASLSLWLADGGMAAVSTVAAGVTAVGIVAGLAGMDLVLLMLLLAARI